MFIANFFQSIVKQIITSKIFIDSSLKSTYNVIATKHISALSGIFIFDYSTF